MLLNTLKELTESFAIKHIFFPERISEIRKTSFVWSKSPGSICLAASKRFYSQALKNKHISAIVAPPQVILQDKSEKAVIVADKAADLFYYLHNLAIHNMHPNSQEEITEKIDPSAIIYPSVHIGKNVIIGKNVHIYPGCYIGDNTVIEDDVWIQPNTVIGVDGLFAKKILDQQKHLTHFGGVKISSGCKIHASVVISKSVNHQEYTVLESGVHIGPHSVIGHDVTIGLNTVISANVVLCGRANIGKECWIGAGAEVSNMCNISDYSKVRIGSTAIDDLPESSDVSGPFAIKHSTNLRLHSKKRK